MLQPASDRDRERRRRQRGAPDLEHRVRADVLGITFLAAALLTVISLFAPEGVILRPVHRGIVGLLGWGAVAVPVVLAVLGLGMWLERFRVRPTVARAAGSLAFLVALGLAQLVAGGNPGEGTGAGGSVGQAIVTLGHGALGDLGAPVALVALLLVALVVAANRPVLDLVPSVWRWRPPLVRPGFVLPGRSATASDDGPVRINAPRPRQRIVEVATTDALREAPAKPRPRLVEPSDPGATIPLERPSAVERPRLFESPAPRPAGEPRAEARAARPAVLASTGRAWTIPPTELLEEGSAARHGEDEIRHNIRVIEETLAHFSIAAKVVEVNVGPVVTRYELKPAAGVKLSRIEALQDDLALALAARSLRIEAPVPGKSVVGIEIPNLAIGLVSVRDVVQSVLFQSVASRLALALGRDIAGAPVIADLTMLPHLLVAGQTGSGKSVCINAIITSLLLEATPDEVRLLLIDPKRVELTGYNGVPHLLVPVVTEHDKILTALRWATGEMDRRYRTFAQAGVRNIDRYNEAHQPAERIPYVVIIIDELADLMILAPIDVEEAITRIAQLARATGIHLVIATQRPSVEVITGLIKANIPARVAFAMASSIDSRTILDMTGADKLLGRGDMLFLPPDQAKPIRAQGVYVSERETDRVTDFWRRQGQPEYQLAVLEAPTKMKGVGDEVEEVGDELFRDAVRVVTQFDRASASLLQRRLRIGYARAARLMDILEERGVVGPGEGSKPRDVLITDAVAFLGENEEED